MKTPKETKTGAPGFTFRAHRFGEEWREEDWTIAKKCSMLLSMKTTVALGEGTINLSYSGEEDTLKVVYSINDNECQLTLSSSEGMGLLYRKVVGTAITYSLRFLEEEETWPIADTLEDEEYASKTVFEAPRWIVIIVQKAE